jgi:transposase
MEGLMAVSITRTELSAHQLRAVAANAKDATAARGMSAIARVLEGVDRKTAAGRCGMDRQALRAGFIARAPKARGLSNRRPAGPASRLSATQKAALAPMVREGPALPMGGVVRWRRVDLRRNIAARFGVTLHERIVGKLPGASRWRHLAFTASRLRPQHPKPDLAALEAFKKTSP